MHSPAAGGSNHEIAVLWEGMKYQAIGIAPEQAQFLETRRFNGQTIAQWYGLAPAIIQDYSDSKFQTVEAQIRHFVMLCLRLWAVRWERALGGQVFGFDSAEFVEFIMAALLRGDIKAQAESNEIKFRNGVLNADEWRAQDNENPLPRGQGQVYWVNNAYSPVDDRRRAAAADPQGRVSYAEKVLNEAFRRMQSIEFNAATRAAAKPRSFDEAIATFYEKFAAKLAEALRIGAEGLVGVDEAAAAAERAAARYCQVASGLFRNHGSDKLGAAISQLSQMQLSEKELAA